MNYKQSKHILEEIKKAKRVFVNCHKGPDPDSVGCALAMYAYLESIGKKARVLCPDDLPLNLRYLPNSDVVEKVDYNELDFSKTDLFIALDSGNWKIVTKAQTMPPKGLNIIVIDHHKTNTKYGKINIVDSEVSSCAEVLFNVLTDFRAVMIAAIATCLLTGIIGDTGVFQYASVSSETFRVAQDLMEHGADKNIAILNIYRRYDLKNMKFFSLVLNNMKIDKEHRFVWSAASFNEFKPYKDMPGARDAKSSAASWFMPVVDKTDFGFLALENKKGSVGISFRSRTGLDVSRIAEELGGGGHKNTSAATIDGLSFDQAVEKVLKVARKWAKKYNKYNTDHEQSS